MEEAVNRTVLALFWVFIAPAITIAVLAGAARILLSLAKQILRFVRWNWGAKD